MNDKGLKSALSLMCFTSLMFVVAFAVGPFQKTETKSREITINNYNRLSKEVDSITMDIDILKRDVSKREKDKSSLLKNITDLKEVCDKIKREKKNTENDNDTIHKSNNDCEQLEIENKKIIQLDSIITARRKVIEKLNTSKEATQKKLENEVKTIRGNLKLINGATTILFKETACNVFVANMDSVSIKMHWKNREGKNYYSIKTLLTSLENQKEEPVMITNAGMYTMNHEPQGLFIEKHGNELRQIDTTNPKTDANFYLKPNGIFFIDTLGKAYIETTEEYINHLKDKKSSAMYATQSGPMLVIDGAIHPAFVQGSPNRKIRSGVGIIDNKHVVFAISKEDMNFYDFALMFKDIFGCKDALFLDGVISLMYLKDIDSNVLGGQFGPMISVTQK